MKFGIFYRNLQMGMLAEIQPAKGMGASAGSCQPPDHNKAHFRT